MDTMRAARITAALSLGFMALLFASAVPAASFNEAAHAAELMRKGDVVGALPLYERLVKREPTNALYAENLAFCLLSKMENLPAGEERNALIQRARFEVNRARTLGDKSNLLQMMQQHLDDPAIVNPSVEDPRLVAAEQAFSRGDYDAALAGYRAIAESDPKAYAARLFAGDVYFKQGDAKSAGEWFQKAIDVDPDQETAWRYWGDSVAQSGDEPGSLRYYIQAVVAEPYSRKSWSGLQQWAQRNGAKLERPVVPAPKVTSGTNEKTGKPGYNIALSPELLADKAGGAAWILYGSTRVAWMTGRFLERNPGAVAYRHSLAEEIDSLQSALILGAKQDWTPETAPASLRSLLRLQQAGMIEAYVLINAADEGIAQDYGAFRKAHREDLARYIDEFMIHRGAAIE